MIEFSEEQKEILKYEQGVMAIPSVPGSGKTFILTHLALKLHKNLDKNEKILLLTYMNSAVENFYKRLKSIDKNINNIEVKTIHKFSLDLIKENIEFLNISPDFSLIDNFTYNRLFNDIFKLWFHENKNSFSVFFKNNIYNLEFQDDFYSSLKFSLQRFISFSKNYGFSPKYIENTFLFKEENSVLALCLSFYKIYQNKLKELNYLDYDDLLYHAYFILKKFKNIRTHYQKTYKYLLEDEAQDSNILQNKIVTLLTLNNLVKAGDSNQNITGTFTLSSPKLFKNFCLNAAFNKNLTYSRRSSENIIKFANLFLKHNSFKHPCLNARKSLNLHFMSFSDGMSVKYPNGAKAKIKAFICDDSQEEFFLCREKIKNFNKKYPNKTIGILCPKNTDVNTLAKMFKEAKMDFDVLNDYDYQNFKTYKKLSELLEFIVKPNNYSIFIKIIEDYLLKEKLSEELKKTIYKLGVEGIFNDRKILGEELIKKLEDLLFFSLNSKEKTLIYISQNFDFELQEVETIENISLNLKSIFKLNPKWSYKDLILELKQVENNRLSYFSWNTKKNSTQNKNITISTYHKSKGREWDFVYLLGLNEDFFPVFLNKEQLGEKDYLNENYSVLEAGILYQLKKIGSKKSFNPIETHKLSRIGESLRIIYVGITRAKEYLILSSNKENQGYFYYSIFSKLIKHY